MCFLCVFTERPSHFCLSCHAHFWFLTFMEMKKIINSACLWSRTEAVTACFMVKSLERKQLHASLMVPPLYGRPPDFWRRSCFFTGSWPASYLLSHFCSSFIILSNWGGKEKKKQKPATVAESKLESGAAIKHICISMAKCTTLNDFFLAKSLVFVFVLRKGSSLRCSHSLLEHAEKPSQPSLAIEKLLPGRGPDPDFKRGFLDLTRGRIQGKSAVQKSKFMKKVKQWNNSCSIDRVTHSQE